jgi:hypothetical protein
MAFLAPSGEALPLLEPLNLDMNPYDLQRLIEGKIQIDAKICDIWTEIKRFLCQPMAIYAFKAGRNIDYIDISRK